MTTDSIRFLRDYEKQDDKAGTADARRYRAGQVIDVRPDTARYYERRGLAERVVTPAPAPAPVAVQAAAQAGGTRRLAPAKPEARKTEPVKAATRTAEPAKGDGRKPAGKT